MSATIATLCWGRISNRGMDGLGLRRVHVQLFWGLLHLLSAASWVELTLMEVLLLLRLVSRLLLLWVAVLLLVLRVRVANLWLRGITNLLLHQGRWGRRTWVKVVQLLLGRRLLLLSWRS